MSNNKFRAGRNEHTEILDMKSNSQLWAELTEVEHSSREGDVSTKERAKI